MEKVLAYVNEKFQEFAMDEMNSDERVRGGNGAMVDKHHTPRPVQLAVPPLIVVLPV
jgi:hypothetical protein